MSLNRVRYRLAMRLRVTFGAESAQVVDVVLIASVLQVDDVMSNQSTSLANTGHTAIRRG